MSWEGPRSNWNGAFTIKLLDKCSEQIKIASKVQFTIN